MKAKEALGLAAEANGERGFMKKLLSSTGSVDKGSSRSSSSRARSSQQRGRLRKGSTAGHGIPVRGYFPYVMLVTKTDDGRTKIDYLVEPDVGGNVPVRFSRVVVKGALEKVIEIQETFQALRGFKEYDEEDGVAIGEALLAHRGKEEEFREEGGVEGVRVRYVFREFRGMREVAEKHKFLEGLLEAVTMNRLRPIGSVQSRLCNISLAEGRIVGSALAQAMAANLTAKAAVAEWVSRHPALKELEKE